MARHHLLRRHREPLTVLGDIAGAQAQVQSFGELSLFTRSEGVTPAWVRRSLLEERSLVKCWAMRGTLHLVTPEDYWLFGAGLGGRNELNWRHWLKSLDLPADYVDRLEVKIRPAVEDGEPRTRKQLAAATGERALLGSWGSLLKPMMQRGVLCFGPMIGPETTFVDAARWLGPKPELGTAEAQEELLRRFLRAYGPATPAAFARWAGARPAWSNLVWRRLEGQLAELRVAGRRAWALKQDLAPLQAAEPSSRLRLLAGFDVYVIGQADKSLVYPSEHAARVSRKSGWISPVVTVGGKVVGVWFHTTKPRQVEVTVELFERLDGRRQRELKAEVEALESFFGRPCGIIEP